MKRAVSDAVAALQTALIAFRLFYASRRVIIQTPLTQRETPVFGLRNAKQHAMAAIKAYCKSVRMIYTVTACMPSGRRS